MALTEEEIKQAREGYVPLDRLNEATGKLKEENARLQESMTALQASVQALKEGQTAQQLPAQQQPPQREYTRAELREFVSSGQITQDQADDYWDQQQELKYERKLQAEIGKVRQDTEVNSSLQGIRSTLAQYRSILPDIAKEGTEDRSKIRAEFQRLARVLGMPQQNSKEELQLQVLALENVFGTVDEAKAKKQRRSSQDSEVEHMETRSPENDVKVPKTEALKKLTPTQKKFYSDGISKGLYKDWSDVEKELTWERKKR